MANIFGEYTLAEAATRLDVSPAWIGKVRKLTGIGGSLGSQGRKANFTDRDLAELDKARFLRNAGISYKELKYMYETEKEILRLSNKVKNPNLVAEAQLYLHAEKLFEIDKNAKGKDVKEYVKQLKRYFKAMEEITAKMIEHAGYAMKKAKELMGAMESKMKKAEKLWKQIQHRK